MQIEAGFRSVWPDAVYTRIPMGDGGEGSVAAIVAATGGSIVDVSVTGPMGEQAQSFFGLSQDGSTGFLEMAAASGLEMVPIELRNPLLATSYGTGELLKAVLDAGVQRILIGIGGSAVVDAGAGMLQALGAQLLDADGKDIGRGGGPLGDIVRVDLAGLDPRLQNCHIDVACDVDNPLLGSQGAAVVFGPQKGATSAMVELLERSLTSFAEVIKRDVGADVANLVGAGAAGGTGAALMACLRATMRPGVQIIAELTGLEAAIRDADLVITGEGSIDSQSARGKTAVGVASIAKCYGKRGPCPLSWRLFGSWVLWRRSVLFLVSPVEKQPSRKRERISGSPRRMWPPYGTSQADRLTASLDMMAE